METWYKPGTLKPLNLSTFHGDNICYPQEFSVDFGLLFWLEEEKRVSDFSSWPSTVWYLLFHKPESNKGVNPSWNKKSVNYRVGGTVGLVDVL